MGENLGLCIGEKLTDNSTVILVFSGRDNDGWAKVSVGRLNNNSHLGRLAKLGSLGFSSLALPIKLEAKRPTTSSPERLDADHEEKDQVSEQKIWKPSPLTKTVKE